MSSSGAFQQLHICYNLSVTVPSPVQGLGACGSRCSSSASYIINPLYVSQSSNGTFNLICYVYTSILRLVILSLHTVRLDCVVRTWVGYCEKVTCTLHPHWWLQWTNLNSIQPVGNRKLYKSQSTGCLKSEKSHIFCLDTQMKNVTLHRTTRDNFWETYSYISEKYFTNIFIWNLSQILRTCYFHSSFTLDWRNITKTKTINELLLRLRATEKTNSHPCAVERQCHWSCLESAFTCVMWPHQNKCSRFRLVLEVNHSDLKRLSVFLSGELSRVHYNSLTQV